MPELSRGRRLVLLLVAALTVLSGILWLRYRELIQGPELAETPKEISLRRVFPSARGWAPEVLEGARAYADSLPSQSIIVLWRGTVLAEWGETDRRTDLHSIRKSVLALLYGIAVERGLVDLDTTLAELELQERGRPLMRGELEATIRDLLTARSGVYHSSVKDDNGPYPEPGSHAPGSTWFYNNWSFNAAGAILEHLTGLTLGEAIQQWLAAPLGMEDFRVEDVLYYEGTESAFPAWRIRMSSRDLARIGLMVSEGGVWENTRIVPGDWIEEMLTPWSDTGNGVGYGYMWWIMPDGSWMATGTGGQKLRIYPDDGLVVVNKVDTGVGFSRALWTVFGSSVDNGQLTELVSRLTIQP